MKSTRVLKYKKITVLLLVCLLFNSSQGIAYRTNVIAPKLQSVLKSLNATQEIPIIITLSDKVDPRDYKDKNIRLRRSKLIKALKHKAEKSQKPFRKFLKNKGSKRIEPLWILNGLAVSVRADVINQLVEMPGIESMRTDDTISEPQLLPAISPTPEWNLD